MKFAAVAAVAAVSLTACATSAPAESSGGVYDPFESWNRQVFAFNETVDKAALEPVARAYRVATPTLFREGVSNVLSNLREPVVFVNSVLQGNADASGETFGRFLINSTVGVVGVFDVASTLGIKEHREDFGQTLGVWGFEEGPFLMLPILGPSNARDVLGMGVDNTFQPLNYIEYEGGLSQTDVAVTRGVLSAVSARESLIETFETLREQPEPYVAMRRTYTSQRKAAIRNGKSEEDPYKDLPDFDDFGDFDG